MIRTIESPVAAAVVAVFLTCLPASAADIDAGKAKAQVCSACHGESGVSVSADIPNLAGQKAKYLATQLKAFRSGKRANPLMKAMASQLDDADVDNLAAHFASLAPGAPGSSSAVQFDGTRVGFPEGYEKTYTQFTTSNRPDNKTVRYLFANDVAMTSGAGGRALGSGSILVMEVYKAKLDGDGKPVVGTDGVYENTGLAGYAVMENREGWGDAYPEALRNGDWSYAFFAPDKTHKAGINEAKCLACHQPLADQDYRFTFAALKAKATQ